MPIVTLIGKKKDPPGRSIALPTGGKIYIFKKGVRERNIPVAVADKCLKINDRDGYLVFRVEDYPSQEKAPKMVNQNVSGEKASPTAKQPEEVVKTEKTKVKTTGTTKKKKKAVQGSF